jgi:hypothetical protein
MNLEVMTLLEHLYADAAGLTSLGLAARKTGWKAVTRC